MKFFAGIVPPHPIYEHLFNIQKQFGDNRLEPHITLRPPVSPLNSEDWISTIARTAAGFRPFSISLPGTDYFGRRVLFVSVTSEPLVQLCHLLTPALKPFEPQGSRAGHEQFNPHLTLGRAWCGFTPDGFKNMQQLADEFLSAGDISFEVSYVRIYHKPGQRYQLYKDVPLGR